MIYILQRQYFHFVKFRNIYFLKFTNNTCRITRVFFRGHYRLLIILLFMPSNTIPHSNKSKCTWNDKPYVNYFLCVQTTMVRTCSTVGTQGVKGGKYMRIYESKTSYIRFGISQSTHRPVIMHKHGSTYSWCLIPLYF